MMICKQQSMLWVLHVQLPMKHALTSDSQQKQIREAMHQLQLCSAFQTTGMRQRKQQSMHMHDVCLFAIDTVWAQRVCLAC